MWFVSLVKIKNWLHVIQTTTDGQRACALHKHIVAASANIEARQRSRIISGANAFVLLSGVPPNQLTRLGCCAEKHRHFLAEA